MIMWVQDNIGKISHLLQPHVQYTSKGSLRLPKWTIQLAPIPHFPFWLLQGLQSKVRPSQRRLDVVVAEVEGNAFCHHCLQSSPIGLPITSNGWASETRLEAVVVEIERHAYSAAALHMALLLGRNGMRIWSPYLTWLSRRLWTFVYWIYPSLLWRSPFMDFSGSIALNPLTMINTPSSFI